MNNQDLAPLLKKNGLRDTQSRRMVLEALRKSKHAASPYDLQKDIARRGGAINTVTVYRILRVLEELGLAHRHPCDGRYVLCTLPERKGHHGFLHCVRCGDIEEFSSRSLCWAENRVARVARFRPSEHVSEILGMCRACQLK